MIDVIKATSVKGKRHQVEAIMQLMQNCCRLQERLEQIAVASVPRVKGIRQLTEENAVLPVSSEPDD